MKRKKIYLIRHGQTDYNLNGVVQGSGIDASLNATGRQQAAAFYDYYRHIPFQKVYTSVLKRSIESVSRFIEDGTPHTALEGLNEINWGTREGIAITPKEDAYYHSVITAWQDGNTSLRIEGGESPEDVYKRQAGALEAILTGAEDTLLVCMHGRAMRILLCQWLNYPLHCMDFFEHANLCLYLLDFTGTMSRIERFNDLGHLTMLSTD